MLAWLKSKLKRKEEPYEPWPHVLTADEVYERVLAALMNPIVSEYVSPNTARKLLGLGPAPEPYTHKHKWKIEGGGRTLDHSVPIVRFHCRGCKEIAWTSQGMWFDLLTHKTGLPPIHATGSVESNAGIDWY